MATTTNLSLSVYDDVDNPTVKEWRDTINRNDSASAFGLIDAWAGAVSGSITGITPTYGSWSVGAVGNGWASTSQEKAFYMKIDKVVLISVQIVGTSNSAYVYIPLPFTAASSSFFVPVGWAYIMNDGVASTTPGFITLDTTARLRVYRNTTAQAFTASGEKRVTFQLFYRATS